MIRSTDSRPSPNEVRPITLLALVNLTAMACTTKKLERCKAAKDPALLADPPVRARGKRSVRRS